MLEAEDILIRVRIILRLERIILQFGDYIRIIDPRLCGVTSTEFSSLAC